MAARAMAIVIGIGLNINATLDHFPGTFGKAPPLAHEAGRQFDRVALLATLVSTRATNGSPLP